MFAKNDKNVALALKGLTFILPSGPIWPIDVTFNCQRPIWTIDVFFNCQRADCLIII
jgi:hypothetical protein